jgi:hypothetical protein
MIAAAVATWRRSITGSLGALDLAELTWRMSLVRSSMGLWYPGNFQHFVEAQPL